jgi:hypothetical protein
VFLFRLSNRTERAADRRFALDVVGGAAILRDRIEAANARHRPECPVLVLTLSLSRIYPLMAEAAIDAIHAGEGVMLPVGAKLLDLTVDLSDSSPQDCPPISHFRIVLREAAWLRRWLVKPGDDAAVGSVLAVFTTGANDFLDAGPARAIRVMTAGIVRPSQAIPEGRIRA